MKKFEFKNNYIFIPLIVIILAVLGSMLTTIGMPWYESTLIKPELTPPRYVFPIAWNTIFILIIISILLVWNKPQFEERYLVIFKRRTHDFKIIIGLFIANGVLNVLWSLLFFALRLIGVALIEMILLELTTLALIILIWKRSKIAALLLTPYLLWVGFATYLTYLIYIVN